MPFCYLKQPDEIYQRSFAMIRDEAALADLPADIAEVAVRLIHACGMTDIVGSLAFHDRVVSAGIAALQAGAPILVDAEMVRHGVITHLLVNANTVLCCLNDADVRPRASELGTTRSAAAVENWRPHLGGAIVAIGNAPTALYHLLEMLEGGADRPAAILAFPVGFVGAAESKQALIDAGLDIPFITLKGRQGGSALAAAAVNALATLCP